MAGMKSLHRNLKSEDAAVERDTRENERLLWGGDAMGATSGKEGADEEIMAAGDIKVENHNREALSGLAKAGIVGLAIAAGGGVTAAAMQWLNRPQQSTTGGNQYEFGLLPPEVEQ